MPAELPAELKEIAEKFSTEVLRENFHKTAKWDEACAWTVESALLAAIPIVARIDAEIAEQQRLQAEHEIECTEGIEYSQAQWRGSEIAARIIKQAILSRWKMED